MFVACVCPVKLTIAKLKQELEHLDQCHDLIKMFAQ